MIEESNLQKNKMIIMLYSGGADSALMLKLAQMSGRHPHCILIDYEQKHIKELEFARDQLNAIGVSWQQITVSGLNVTSGLTGDLREARWSNAPRMHWRQVPIS